MATAKVEVLEPHARHIGSAMLFINGDGSWSVGTKASDLVRVKLGDVSLDDSLFGFSAVAAERDAAGGYRLFLRADADEDVVAEIGLTAAGQVDLSKVALLSLPTVYALEDQFKVDLNNSGNLGGGFTLLQGGSVNLYLNERGQYQVGSSEAGSRPLLVGGAPLDDQRLPAGWEIVELVPRGNDTDVLLQGPGGVILDATFDANGGLTGAAFLAGADLTAYELANGVDIDGNNDLPAPSGWTSQIQNGSLRGAVDGALASTAGGERVSPLGLATPLNTPPNTITHTELVAILRTFIQQHKDNNNAPVTAQELADLQAIAARGKALFGGNGPAGDYLSYSLQRLVEGSDANRYFQGGQVQRSELGSLGAGSPIAQFERLVDKWLLGGDLPSPATAGDSATGAARSVVAAYAKSSGTLFVDGTAIADVNQGTAGDCYLIAVMGGLAQNRGTVLQGLFVENAPIDGVRTWGVRLFDGNGNAHWVTVNDMLPVTEAGSTTLAYAGPANKTLNGEIWVPLLEKAYAQANTLGILPRDKTTGQNSYAAIEGGFGDPLGAFIPAKVVATIDPGSTYGPNPYLVTRTFDRNDPQARIQLETDLAAIINAGKMVWVGVSNTQRDSFGNQLLVGGHAHFLLDANPSDPNNRDVLAYNPWGLVQQPEPPGPTQQQFISPAGYTLAQLVGIAGVDFMWLDGPGG